MIICHSFFPCTVWEQEVGAIKKTVYGSVSHWLSPVFGVVEVEVVCQHFQHFQTMNKLVSLITFTCIYLNIKCWEWALSTNFSMYTHERENENERRKKLQEEKLFIFSSRIALKIATRSSSHSLTHSFPLNRCNVFFTLMSMRLTSQQLRWNFPPLKLSLSLSLFVLFPKSNFISSSSSCFFFSYLVEK